MIEKTRIKFNKLVVTAVELSTIERSVKKLSQLAPSDALIKIDFNGEPGEYTGTIRVNSASTRFEETVTEANLIALMAELYALVMVRINLWKDHRFDISDKNLLLQSNGHLVEQNPPKLSKTTGNTRKQESAEIPLKLLK